MENLPRYTVKGKITPFTPKNSYRTFDLPEEVVKDVLKYKVEGRYTYSNWTPVTYECYVNDRLINISSVADFGNDVLVKRVSAYVKDDPRPSKKPKQSEINAVNVYMEFCKSGDWGFIFSEWSHSQRTLFRKKLLEMLKSHPITKDCDNCAERFKCLTVMMRPKTSD